MNHGGHDHAAMGHDHAAMGHDHAAMGHDHAAMGHDHAAMGHDHGGGSGCKISMLFNLNTIDSCFLSSDWRITSTGMFAGSCLGVFFLAMVLELLRRSVKEFDRYLVRQHAARFRATPGAPDRGSVSCSKDGAPLPAAAVVPPFRPNLWQQAVRALLHLCQFVVAYFLMLLAMYYNGYIILCIFLGAFFGAFVFQWETLSPADQQTSAANEATVCCG